MGKTNKFRQLLALIIVLASTSLAVAIFLKVHRGGAPAEHVSRLPNNVDMSLQKIHFTETKDGIKKWDLLADRTDYDKVRDVAHLTAIQLVVAGVSATGDVTLTADKADYNMKTRDVLLQGNVAARTTSGMSFSTDQATFHSDREVIRSVGQVKFSDDRIEVEGAGMEFSTRTRDLRMSSSVVAKVKVMGKDRKR